MAMVLEFVVTLLLSVLAVMAGVRWGRLLVRRGATANNFFTGKNIESIAFLGLYILLLLLALYLPQLQILPLEWRVSGMRVTWSIMRILLVGFCGAAFWVSYQTDRRQMIAVVLLGVIGWGGFTSAEAYFLAPIYPSLRDHLMPNGVYRQTSNSSCAPAAMATILRQWDLDIPESRVAQLAGTSRLGTSMPQLIMAARSLGLDAVELSPTWEQMRQMNRPGVLATWLYSRSGRDPHAVGLVAMTADTVTIADPAFGKLYELNRASFDRIWRKEYVPIFRPEDLQLTRSEAANYLRRLGYLQPTATSGVSQALQSFQREMGLSVTGRLDPQTILLLTGSFLSDVPTLSQPLSAKTTASSLNGSPGVEPRRVKVAYRQMPPDRLLAQ
ncbi:MAG: cysteine peptidase family C39 domain-containing protein [Elainella sp. Prado103]|jgi:predicted double-glycine peptidase|nr:cysteine peptidase family C39 domain-containing protein [Elainella sp. Prado103]